MSHTCPVERLVLIIGGNTIFFTISNICGFVLGGCTYEVFDSDHLDILYMLARTHLHTRGCTLVLERHSGITNRPTLLFLLASFQC